MMLLPSENQFNSYMLYWLQNKVLQALKDVGVEAEKYLKILSIDNLYPWSDVAKEYPDATGAEKVAYQLEGYQRKLREFLMAVPELALLVPALVDLATSTVNDWREKRPWFLDAVVIHAYREETNPSLELGETMKCEKFGVSFDVQAFDKVVSNTKELLGQTSADPTAIQIMPFNLVKLGKISNLEYKGYTTWQDGFADNSSKTLGMIPTNKIIDSFGNENFITLKYPLTNYFDDKSIVLYTNDGKIKNIEYYEEERPGEETNLKLFRFDYYVPLQYLWTYDYESMLPNVGGSYSNYGKGFKGWELLTNSTSFIMWTQNNWTYYPTLAYWYSNLKTNNIKDLMDYSDINADYNGTVWPTIDISNSLVNGDYSIWVQPVVWYDRFTGDEVTRIQQLFKCQILTNTKDKKPYFCCNVPCRKIEYLAIILGTEGGGVWLGYDLASRPATQGGSSGFVNRSEYGQNSWYCIYKGYGYYGGTPTLFIPLKSDSSTINNLTIKNLMCRQRNDLSRCLRGYDPSSDFDYQSRYYWNDTDYFLFGTGAVSISASTMEQLTINNLMQLTCGFGTIWR